MCDLYILISNPSLIIHVINLSSCSTHLSSELLRSLTSGALGHAVWSDRRAREELSCCHSGGLGGDPIHTAEENRIHHLLHVSLDRGGNPSSGGKQEPSQWERPNTRDESGWRDPVHRGCEVTTSGLPSVFSLQKETDVLNLMNMNKIILNLRQEQRGWMSWWNQKVTYWTLLFWVDFFKIPHCNYIKKLIFIVLNWLGQEMFSEEREGAWFMGTEQNWPSSFHWKMARTRQHVRPHVHKQASRFSLTSSGGSRSERKGLGSWSWGFFFSPCIFERKTFGIIRDGDKK